MLILISFSAMPGFKHEVISVIILDFIAKCNKLFGPGKALAFLLSATSSLDDGRSAQPDNCIYYTDANHCCPGMALETADGQTNIDHLRKIFDWVIQEGMGSTLGCRI